MRVFVINLEARADRRSSVIRQLEPTGIDYEFFRAVEAPGALDQYFEGRSDWACHMEIERAGQPSEVACYASHLCLWKTCVELGESIVILEDDFAVSPIFTQAIEFVAEYTDTYGFIRLETMEDRWQLNELTKPLPVLQTEAFTLYFQTTVSLRATGYSISPPTAQRFIDISRKFTMPVDHVFRRPWIHQLPLFAIDPPAIGLTELADESSITGRVKSPARHFLRQAKMAYREWAKYATRRTNARLIADYPELLKKDLLTANSPQSGSKV